MKLTKRSIGRPRKETPVAVTHPPLHNPYPRKKATPVKKRTERVPVVHVDERPVREERTIERVLRAFANDLEESFASSPALPELEAAITQLMHKRGLTFLIPNN